MSSLSATVVDGLDAAIDCGATLVSDLVALESNLEATTESGREGALESDLLRWAVSPFATTIEPLRLGSALGSFPQEASTATPRARRDIRLG